MKGYCVSYIGPSCPFPGAEDPWGIDINFGGFTARLRRDTTSEFNLSHDIARQRPTARGRAIHRWKALDELPPMVVKWGKSGLPFDSSFLPLSSDSATFVPPAGWLGPAGTIMQCAIVTDRSRRGLE